MECRIVRDIFSSFCPYVLRSPHTDPVASLGMAGVANPLELKKWIGMLCGGPCIVLVCI